MQNVYVIVLRQQRTLQHYWIFRSLREIGAYINNEMISAIEQSNAQKGYMDGRSLSVTFSLLKENSLYWNYYVNNYLKGINPIDFDLLYWNGDSTNVTEKCHSTLLRSLYLNNKLIDPKGLKINDVYLDLTKIKVPLFYICSRRSSSTLEKYLLWRFKSFRQEYFCIR